jgi:hypothetical protein
MCLLEILLQETEDGVFCNVDRDLFHSSVLSVVVQRWYGTGVVTGLCVGLLNF